MFFVLGMPRSRTYWMSRFLDCTHEGLWYYPNYSDLVQKGLSDSTTCYPYIKDTIKGYKKVIIHRDRYDVRKSLRKLFNTDIDLDVFDGMEQEHGLHVQYTEINDRLPEIWEYCKGTEVPTEKLHMKDTVLNNKYLIQEVQKCL